MSWEVRVGDALEQLRAMDDASVDAVVTDPPYGIGFMGHEWDQPGEHGPVRSNGTPAPFARGRAQLPGQRRVRNPAPSGFGSLSKEKRQKLGQRAVSRERPGAMEAGRYDLSLSANQRFQEWCEAWAVELLRVLKPGGHCLVFGGTRTYHRLTSGLEDAGFEVRDCLMWLYGSGFPKSLDVSKAIDKAARGVPQGGADPTSPNHGRYRTQATEGKRGETDRGQGFGAGPGQFMAEAGESDDRALVSGAQTWEGWGTALKPSWEPIVVARKPYAGTVAGNVLEHGTAALNIDGCRVALNGDAKIAGGAHGLYDDDHCEVDQSTGRWPANVLLAHDEDCVLVGRERVRADGHFPAARGASGYGSSVPDSNGGGLKGQEDLEERHFDGELVERWACVPGCPVRMLDDSAGTAGAAAPVLGTEPSSVTDGIYGFRRRVAGVFHGDAGGPSRFYYCAKASRAEREAGLDGFGKKDLLWSNGTENPGSFQSDGAERSARNHHPTVKPIDLMRWLVRLVTPPGGVVLDCFAGSGTTGCAAVLEGFAFVGVERQEDYAAIARARVGFWEEHPTGLTVDAALQAESRRRRVRESGQLGLDV